MTKYNYSVLTCRNCGTKNEIKLTNEEYDNDYDITCNGCQKGQAISQYDYDTK